MKTYYEVAVLLSSSNYETKVCGHKHRTEKAAEKCREKLLYAGCTGNNHNAAWHNCFVTSHSDEA